MAVASIPVDWGLAQGPPNLDFTPSVLEGLQAAQQERAISALHGIDMSNPSSLNSGMNALVQAGAADQAAALMKLQLTRGLVNGLPNMLSSLGSLGAQQGQPGSDQSAAPSPQGQPSASMTPAQQAHATQVMQFGKSSVDQLLQISDPQLRQDQADALGAQAAQMGVDPQQISAITGDLSDQHLQSLSDNWGQWLQHPTFGGQGLPGGATPDLHPIDAAHLQSMPGAPAWAQAYLSNPGLQAQLGVMKGLTGIDLGGQLGENARALMAPEIAKQAEAAHAAQIAGETARGAAPYGLDTVTLPNGSTAQVPHNLALALGAGGALHGLTPEQQAYQSASGTAAGSAPYTKVEVTGPHGETQAMTGQQFHDRGVGNPGGVVSTGPSLSGGRMQAGDAQALVDNAQAAAQRLPGYADQIAREQTLVGLANSVGTSAYTGALQKAAAALPGGPQKYAANAGLLASDLSTSFRQALGGLPVPRVASEAKAITGQIPTNSAPQDQVKVYSAGLLAATQYQQKHDAFLANWAAQSQSDPGRYPPSFSAAESAWINGPGRASIFAQPAWEGLKIGGKEAVGHVTVRGRHYLIPLPGLLGQNVTPVQAF